MDEFQITDPFRGRRRLPPKAKLPPPSSAAQPRPQASLDIVENPAVTAAPLEKQADAPSERPDTRPAPAFGSPDALLAALKPRLPFAVPVPPGSRATPAGSIPFTAAAPEASNRGVQPLVETPAPDARTTQTEPADGIAAPIAETQAPPADTAPSGEPSPTENPSAVQDAVAKVRRAPTTRPKPGAEPRGSKSPMGAIVLTALALALLSYTFNFGHLQSWATTTLSRLNASAQAQGSIVIPFFVRAVPWLLFLPAILLLYAVLSMLAGMFGLKREKKAKDGNHHATEARPSDSFKRAAYAEGIPFQTAYQAFVLLQSNLPDNTVPGLADRLEDDLHLAPTQLRSLHLALLAKLGRSSDAATRLPRVITVLDLLRAVEAAPRQRRESIDEILHLPSDPSRRPKMTKSSQ